jgi:AcrR family transcriptional regulator
VSTVLTPWPEPPALEVPPAPGSRRDWVGESWEERYRRHHFELLDVAGRLVNELGYEGTQVSDIVREASVSKRTFYEHFNSKDDCFAHLIRNNRVKIIEAMITAAEEAIPLGPYETFRSLLDAWRRHLATRPRLYEAMRNSGEGALDAEQRTGVNQIAEVFAVAAVRLGAAGPTAELTRLSRYFTWGAFGVLAPTLVRGRAAGEDVLTMATAMCRGFGLTASDLVG